jgi:hypothetical protein
MADVLRELDAVRQSANAQGPKEPRPHGDLSFPRPSDSAAPEQASIVVLPFENLSPDPDNAYFADGLTEELIADLSKVKALRVISRTSAMRYRGTTKPLPEIATELAEPLGPIWVAWIQLYSGRQAEALVAAGRHLDEFPNAHRRFMAAWIRAWVGERQRAIDILAPIEAPPIFDYVTQLCLLLRTALEGDRAAFQQNLTTPLTEAVGADAWGACTIAECLGILGDIDAALPWLDRAAEWGWFNYPLYAENDPFFEALRGHPRFQAFLDRVRTRWEAFEE